ncbi:MAG: hypothetical protein R3Y54_14325 [Eubacteriales bacterium]
MRNDIKPNFINLLEIEGVEIDINELPEQVKEEIAIELNSRAMLQIGYEEMK